MRLPRHSTITAYGALFVALGGTSYAATQLPARSIGTLQLRNGSVTRAKLNRSVQTEINTPSDRLSRLIAHDATSAATAAMGTGAASVAVDGTASSSYLTVTRAATGVYCITVDKTAIPSPHAAVVSPEGDGTQPLSAVVQQNPTSGPCVGQDFQVAMHASNSLPADAPFFILVN